MSIAIIDYGMANLRSVQKALAEIGKPADIISTPAEIAKSDKIVLPGVGAFRDAIATLREKKLADPIIAHIRAGKPFLELEIGDGTATEKFKIWEDNEAYDTCSDLQDGDCVKIDATFFRISPADVLSKWVGEAEQNIKKLFDAAAAEPRSIIFIDEIEALVPARRDEGSSVMQIGRRLPIGLK